MKILLFGKNGQLGWELQRALQPLGEVIALGRDAGEEQQCGDLCNIDAICHTIDTLKPDVIINAAAYTGVDKAQCEPELAHTVNAKAPGAMAEEAEKIGAWLVHYSSDYVFPGTGNKPWSEEDPTEPLSVYGCTKLAGEQEIEQVSSRYIILRTSWVYSARGSNFAKTMLRLAHERDTLKVVNDQIGSPTGAELIADVSSYIVRDIFCPVSNQKHLPGIYHLSADGFTSWHEYARLVLRSAEEAGYRLQVKSDAIEAIPTSAYPTPAPRPQNSRLNTEKIKNTFNLHLPSWEHGVKRMLEEILATGDEK